MSVVKVIEILAQSEKGWEDATRQAVKAASKSVKNIQNIYIKEFKADVEDNEVTVYRVNAKVSFVVE